MCVPLDAGAALDVSRMTSWQRSSIFAHCLQQWYNQLRVILATSIGISLREDPRRIVCFLFFFLSFFLFFFSYSSNRGPWEWSWVPLRLANREIIFRAAPNYRNIFSNHKGNRLRHLNVFGNIRSLGAPCYTTNRKRKTQQKAAGYRGNQPECRIHKAFLLV